MALSKSQKKRAGSLDTRGTFQQWAESGSDGMGGSTGSWGGDKDVWISLHPVSAKEKLEMEKLQSNVTHMVQMRYNDFDFDNENRLKVGNRIFNLQYVLNEGEDDAFLQMTAVEQ